MPSSTPKEGRRGMIELIKCGSCGQPVAVRSARCWRCGHPVSASLQPRTAGLRKPSSGPANDTTLTLAGRAAVVLSVCAIVLLAGVTLMARDQAIRTATGAEGPAAAETPAQRSPVSRATPEPLPSAEPGTWVVGDGESLFSVARETGIDANLIVHWNAETYPSLRSSPALKRGWVLRLSGPMPPTPAPRPTRAPPGTPQPIEVAGLPAIPTIDASSFSAPAKVVTYDISGFTVGQLLRQLQTVGPEAPWGDGSAVAVTETVITYHFTYRSASNGGCEVVTRTSGDPVSLAFTVTLPRWTPTARAAPSTVEWWINELLDIVEHENHHIDLYLGYLAPLNEAVRNGTCETVPLELERLLAEATLDNCRFDYEEYGRELGLDLQECLDQ
jgi:predicted secreted Zn-dependent protease